MIGRRLTRAAALACATAVVVAGCAGVDAYDPDTASDLQQQTLAVTTAAAEGEWDAAALKLMALEADARDAHARGLITSERLESIIAAIVLVGASLDVERAAADAERATREQEEREAAERTEREAAEQAAREGAGGGGPGGGPGNDNAGPGGDNSGPGNNSGPGRGGRGGRN